MVKIYYVVSNELYHHGIKGQRWGVRRFQNADGSLKKAGIKRQTHREKELSIAKNNLAGNKREINSINKSLEDLDKNKYNSKTWKEAFGDDGNKSDSYFKDYLGYDSKKEAFDLLKQGLKDERKYRESSVNLEKQKINQLKNAKLSDKTFVEMNAAGKRRADAIFVAISAIGAGASSFFYSKQAITGKQAVGFALGASLVGGIIAGNASMNSSEKGRKSLKNY